MTSQVRRVATLELVPDRNARRVLAAAVFVVLTALGAHVEVPLLPVPITLQTMFVVLSGILLGPWLGAASQLAYLGAGLAGAPVFAVVPGLPALVGPTAGYLLAFPAAALLAGWIAGPAGNRGLVGALRLTAGAMVASFAILASGAAWLALTALSPERALALGLVPFLPGDVLKTLLAVLIAWRIRPRTLGRL
ncbi:MAG: biotin transporter BioY [Gemmatimonadota bacterium]